MKKYFLSFFLILAMLIPNAAFAGEIIGGELNFANPGFYMAADDGIYEIDTIEKGEIICRYPVVNNESGERSVTVLTCLFSGGTLTDISYNSKTVSSSGSGVFEDIVDVSKFENSEIRVYVIEDINMGSPLVQVMTLSEKSRNNKVEEFAIDGLKAMVNHLSGRIDIRVPYETNLTNCTPEVKVAAGAEYTISSLNLTLPVILSVTAENGDARDYTVYVEKELPESTPVECDFEGDVPGEVPSGWKLTDNNSGTAFVTTDPDNPENQVVMVEDTGSDAVYLSLPVSNMYYPFEIEFRINGGHDGEYVKTEADLAYCMAIVGTKMESKSSICGIGYSESKNGIGWMARTRNDAGDRVEVAITGTVNKINEWHKIKMIYRSDYMVEYHIDGDYIATKSANAYLDTCELFWLTTSTARKARMYLDDLKITHIEGESLSSSLNMDFEDMTPGEIPDGVWTTGTTAVVCETTEGKAVSFADTSVGWSIGQVENGASLELDILVDESNPDTGAANIILGDGTAGFGIQTNSDGNLVLTDYNSGSAIPATALENGVNHRMRLEVFRDELTGHVLSAVFADGILAYVCNADESALNENCFEIEAMGENAVLIDNIIFE